MNERAFSHRGARSTPLLCTLVFLVAGESAGVHFLLFRHSPVLASLLSFLGVCAIAWLIADHAALGRRSTTVTAEEIVLRVGRRASAVIPRALVASAVSPTWRDIPASPSPSYLNPTKPAEPNVLLSLTEPAMVRLPGGLRRPVRLIGLYLDTPEAFIAALQPVGSNV